MDDKTTSWSFLLSVPFKIKNFQRATEITGIFTFQTMNLGSHGLESAAQATRNLNGSNGWQHFVWMVLSDIRIGGFGFETFWESWKFEKVNVLEKWIFRKSGYFEGFIFLKNGYFEKNGFSGKVDILKKWIFWIKRKLQWL